VETRAADGESFTVDLPRVTAPAGLGVGVNARLRPRRVFVFPEAVKAE
jgi:hypothetical protein